MNDLIIQNIKQLILPKATERPLKGKELDEALVNTLGSIDNWQSLLDSLNKRLKDENISEEEKEVTMQTIEDTEYQINSANEIVKLLHSAKTKERIDNERKD